MLKKDLSIKIDYLSIVFDTMKADELIRKVLRTTTRILHDTKSES